MSEAVQFFIRHGYLLLCLSVLLQQLGLPLPSTPFLLAAGALAHSGQLSFARALFLAVAAALLADLTWYRIGRLRGVKVLGFLCRISLEPDYCVRRAENTFVRHGPKMLLVAKFIPGISAVATPLAGISGLPLPPYLLYSGTGILLWVGTYELIGYLFADQLEQVIDYSSRFGSLLLVVMVAGVAAYIGWKYIQRERFLRSLRVARITPSELKQRLDEGHDLLIVDLRQELDFNAEPKIIPGALRLAAEDLEQRGHEIPRDRTLVLYCS